jgi:hypothetical protein
LKNGKRIFDNIKKENYSRRLSFNLIESHRFSGKQFYQKERYETFEKCSILVKIKEGENFNHRNILDISRIKI